MAQKYRKDKLSKNGSNWYIQFHIADWMRELPTFNNYPDDKKNFKESLRTSDYELACERRDKRLIELHLKETPPLPPLKTGQNAYWSAINEISTLNDEQLEKMHDIYTELMGNSFSEYEPFETGEGKKKTVIHDEVLHDNASNYLQAIEREAEKRGKKFFYKPHPYHAQIKSLCEDYIKELIADGRDRKTQSKARLSVQRFLDFLEQDDIELRLITSKLLNDYRKQASSEDRSLSTFRSDLHHLSSIFEFAKREGMLFEHLLNPFKNVKLTNLREGETREPFTREILEMLVKLSEGDRDRLQTVILSYYTGMRISEVYTAKVVTYENTLCLSVAEDGGKTQSATRIIPMHNQLIKFLNDRNWMPSMNEGFVWETSSDNGLGKKFLRLKNNALGKLDLSEHSSSYVHHSFRHGFSRMLLQKGYNELEAADLLGHKRENIGRTEAGRSYFSRQDISKLVQMVESIEILATI